MNKLSLFRNFFREHGKIYVIGVFLLMMTNLLFLMVPKLIGLSIDTLDQGKEHLLDYVLMILGIGLVILLIKLFSRRALLGSIRHMEYGLRHRLFHHALAIPISYYEKNGPGKVMALMTNDVTSLRVALGLGMMILVEVLFFGVFSFFIVAHETSLLLAITLLLPMPIILSITIFLGRRMRKAQREAQNSFSNITEFTQELFLGMNVIRAFNKELKSIERFQLVNRENYKRNMKVAFLDSLVAPLTYILPSICYALNIYLSGSMIVRGEISIGDFVALNGYLVLLIGPLIGLGALVAVLQKGAASLDRICTFLEVPQEPEELSELTLPLMDIKIKNLSFVYPETTRKALDNITLNIPAGSFVGFVGGPGSGKSTLFKLLLRLYEVPNHSIFFGEEEIQHIPLDMLRRSISYVSPQAYILGTTIKDNITFGEESIHPLTIEEAAKRAALTADLGLTLKSTAQQVKEGGTDLSGGQRQRVNLARGFYKNAPYLLLDDSLSALDFISASEVLKYLRKTDKQTLIFISQRIEALKGADCIYVFKDNCIVEQGTHENLLALQGEYCRLYAQQLQGGGANE